MYMEKIRFAQGDTEEFVDFFVLEQARLNGFNYILVTDSEEERAQAFILKDLSKEEDKEADYVIVEDEKELEIIAEIFEQMLDDICFEK